MSAVLLLFAAMLTPSPVLKINPEFLRPADGWNSLPDPGRFLISMDDMNRLLAALTNDRWKLPADLTAGKRFKILSSYLPVPHDLIPFPGYENLDGNNLFRRYKIGYNNRLYHLMVSPLEEKKTDTATAKKLLTPGGWRWDISSDVKLVLRGTQNINLSWGTDVIDDRLREGTHVRRVNVLRDFKLGQDLDLNLAGKIGPRINISIDHNSTRNENKYDISYNGLADDFIKLIKAGNVQFKLPGSRYVTYSGASKDAFGIKAVLASKKFRMESILSLTKGISETKQFSGKKSETTVQIKDIAYIKRQFFILPDKNLDSNSVKLYITTTVTNQGVEIAGAVYRLLVPGTDYAVNNQTGGVNLVKPLSLDQNLLITYKSGGVVVPSFSTIPAEHRLSAQLSGDNVNFLYLKKIGQYSLFSRKGIYRIGYGNIDLTRGFQFQVIETESGARSSKVQFSTADYTLNQQSGLIEFNALEPFSPYGVPETLYHTAADPVAADSTYTLELIFFHQVDTFQLRYNIIPGSEKIKLNNRTLKAGKDYTIDYITGKLQFLIPIADNDSIEVTYEYKPYSASLQRTLFGTRAEFQPVAGVKAGATLIYSGGQKPTGAPTAQSPPDSRLVLDVDGTIDFIKLFSLDSSGWRAVLRGEWAYSVHDKNTVDKALFTDMESDTTGSALTRNETSWKIGSPSPHINGGLKQADRGRLWYRDYRDYGLNDSYTLKSYYWDLPAGQILDYSRKPGPYTVKGGHNEGRTELNETSIVFEYDFSGGKSWTSAVTSVAGAGGIDLSRINQLLLSLKHQLYSGVDGNGKAQYSDSSGGSVAVYLEVGFINEDSDGDSVFDTEATLGSGGYSFNPVGGFHTLVGGGRKGSGNGILDSEDLNRDNVFQTNESSVSFPAAGFSDPDQLIVPTGDGWQQYSIWIKNLDSTRRSVLRSVSAVRLTLMKSGVNERGRILLDRVWFKGTKWDRLTVDGNNVNGTVSTNFKTAVISTRENSEYRNNRIYTEYGDLFEDLHGDLSSAEEEKFDEKALQIKYSLGGVNSSGSVAKVFNSKIDFTIYRKLNLFLYIKERPQSDTNQVFIYRIANSENRYYEWRIPLTMLPVAADAAVAGKKKWQKITVHLDPDDVSLKMHATSGDLDFGVARETPLKPNLREITRTVAGVDAGGASTLCNGELWLNEVHLSDDKSKKGSAWTVSGEFSKLKKPLLQLGKFQLFGPFSFAFDYQNIGLGFKNLGDNSSEQSRLLFNASGSVRLLHFFYLSFHYNDEESNSDKDSGVVPLHLQFGNTNTTYKHSLTFKHRGYWPQIKHSYTRKIVQNLKHRLYTPADGSEYITDAFTRQYSEDALIELSGKLPLGLTHTAKVSDSFFLTDISEKTNLEPQSWFTNSTTQAYATYKKEAGYQLQLEQRNLLIRGSAVRLKSKVYRLDEAYNRNDKVDGLRSLFNSLSDVSMLHSYRTRMDELLGGVFKMEESLNGTNTSARSRGFQLSASLERFGFLSLHCSFDRSSKDANFVETTNLIVVKNNATVAKSEAGFDMRFPAFPLRMVKGVFSRNFSFSQTAGTDQMDDIWSSYRGGFFKTPFYYLGLFGKGGRFEDFKFVDRFSDSESSTYVKLINKFTLSGRLDFGRSFLDFITPDTWTYSLHQQTGRNLSSYSQLRSWAVTLTKNFPLRKLKFGIFDESTAKGKKVGDLIWKWSWGRKYDYTTKVISDKLQTSADWSVRWSRNLGLKIGYVLKYETGRQSLFAGDKDYIYMGLGADTGAGQGDSFGDLEEQNDGSPPGYSELPQLTRWEHVIKLQFDFPTKHKPEISVFGIKIPMDPEWVHSNLVELHLYDSSYAKTRDGTYNFSELFDRTFLLKLTHGIGYDFSGSWNGNFYLSMIFEQWRLIRPDAQTTGLITEKFKLSFGIELGLKMKIRF